MPLVVESYAPGGRNAQTTPASRVLVLDDHGNPLILAVECADGGFHVSHLQDPDFAPLLRTFGYTAPAVGRVIQPGDR